MKIKIITAIALIALFLSSCGMLDYYEGYDRGHGHVSKDIVLIEDESWYNDFSVKNNTVNIMCVLTFKNNSDKEKRFYLTGDFSEDQRLGLVRDKELRGVDYDTKSELLTIEGNKKRTYNYVFKGDFAGKKQKANRLLPEIEIQEAE
ncbi:MAG: hypothetical protein IIU14_02695 [Ruminococcus sp.]|nr:hypothetical protein [Ruminococcus sp.]